MGLISVHVAIAHEHTRERPKFAGTCLTAPTSIGTPKIQLTSCHRHSVPQQCSVPCLPLSCPPVSFTTQDKAREGRQRASAGELLLNNGSATGCSTSTGLLPKPSSP